MTTLVTFVGGPMNGSQRFRADLPPVLYYGAEGLRRPDGIGHRYELHTGLVGATYRYVEPEAGES